MQIGDREMVTFLVYWQKIFFMEVIVMKYKTTTLQLCCGALMTAIICIMTIVIQVPIPLGYAHLGDAFILLTASYLRRREAVLASALGSSLADLLTGFTEWVLPTFFIKMILALIASSLMTDKKGNFRLFQWKTHLAGFLSMAWMVCGYTIAGSLLYGSPASGIASAPGLIMEGIINLIVYYLLAGVCERAKIRHLLPSE